MNRNREELTQAAEKMEETLCGLTAMLALLPLPGESESTSGVGGMTREALVAKAGGRMTGTLQAWNDTTGGPAVRNIRYGTVLPEVVAEGEIFLLLAEEV